ncbi:peptide transporter family 1 isoform X2 [Copidosoma floridanum]|nr:peptide transporter family 1 isoform X2 [Copidosoma floridanum]
MMAYFFPLLGGIISDSWLGKYRTILYLSIVYALGQLLLSASSVPPLHLPVTLVSFVGLLLIALGTGGIKPCVSSFGGDQFKLPQQEKYMSTFFSLFYFAINAGSLISTIITPILREDFKCYGQQTCFPLAFFVPAILMVVSVVIFFAGKNFYTRKQPEGNIFVRVIGCICHAIGRKISSKEKCDHWLDLAEDKYDRRFLDDVKSVLKVLTLFIPLPFFWALYDQQGSRWTFQAVNMNGNVFGYHIKADQFQVVNPLFILIFIPIFKIAIYPIMEKFFFINTPLKKLTVGGFFTAVSFLISALVELNIESTYIAKPQTGMAQLRLFNTLNCPVGMSIGQDQFVLESLDMYQNLSIPLEDDVTVGYHATFKDCTSASNSEASGTIELKNGEATTVALLPSGKMFTLGYNDEISKSSSGYPKVRTAIFLGSDSPKNATLTLKGDMSYDFALTSTFNVTKFRDIRHHSYDVYFDDNLVLKDVTMENGAVFTIVGSKMGEEPAALRVVQLAEPNTVHMLWLLPQYVVITMGEIMFSITGLEFAFTQAPASMKALLTAGWLLTVAFGNLIVVVIAKLHFFDRQVFEFLLFAILMFIDITIFAVMAMFYKYADVSSSTDNSTSEEVDMEPRKGTYNGSYKSDDY